MANLSAGGFVDSRYNASPAVVGGYTYTEATAITAPNTNPPVAVGGPLPNLFGFTAAHIQGLSRCDYEIGVDQVVRWGQTVPNLNPAVAKDDPIGK